MGSAHLTTRPGLAAAAAKAEVWLKHRGHKRHWRRKSQGEQSAELVCGSQLASLFVSPLSREGAASLEPCLGANTAWHRPCRAT